MDYNQTFNMSNNQTNFPVKGYPSEDGFLLVILIFSGLLVFFRCCVIAPMCDNCHKTDNGGIDKIECYICVKIFNYFCPKSPERIYADTDSDSEYDSEDYYYVKDETNIYQEFINNNPRSDNHKLAQKYNNKCTICLEPLIDNINDDSVVIDMPIDTPEDIDTDTPIDIDIDTTEEIDNNKINSLDLDTDHTILLKCGHSFHLNCIKNWDKGFCPNCKTNIEIDSWY